MLKKFAFVFVTFFLVPSLAVAYTNPGKPQGFVSDFAEMLKSETVSNLETELNNFSQNTGNQISVVTVSNLGGDTIENYAVKLFKEWGIGDKEKDTGLLLLIAQEEREIRIEVGYGLEPVITDLESSHIIRDVLTPAFKKGDYDGGITMAISRIKVDLENGYSEVDYKENSSRSFINSIDFSTIVYVFFFVIMVLGTILGRSRSWWAGGVFGVLIGIIIGLIKGFLFIGIFSILALGLFGLLLDFFASKSHTKHKDGGGHGPWFWGGGFGGGHGGGFGGFGGGMSGGGGASGRFSLLG